MIIFQVNVSDFGIDVNTINPIINSFIKENIFKKVRGENPASITPFNLHTFNNKAIEKILDLVLDITPKIAISNAVDRYINDNEYENILNHTLKTKRWNPKGFHLAECWGVVYNGQQGLTSHHHFPFSLSFSYYSKADEKSSSLNICGQEILAKEGYLTIFSAHFDHEVRPEDNMSDERIALVGNLQYHGFTLD